MPGKGKERAIFADESEEDSVATDSTAESEFQEEYGVERVLAEDGEDGDKQYLLKWEGYPLARSNWEPADNILGTTILEQWEAEKERQRENGVDLDQWQEAAIEEFQLAVEAVDREKQKRRRRRKAKRRKRGIAVSTEGSGDDGESDGDGGTESLFVEKRRQGQVEDAPPSAKKRVKQPEVQRKGLAQRVKPKNRRTMVSSASSSEADISSDSGERSSDDSLLEELAANSRSSQNKTKRNKARGTRTKPEEEEVDSEDDVALMIRQGGRKNGARSEAVSASNTSSKAATSRVSPIQPSTALQKQVPASAPKKKTTPGVSAPPATSDASTANRSTAPKAKRSRKPDNILANWDAKKSRKHIQRVSGATPKDSTDRQFRNMSTQYKHQMYSKNELAPDPNALTMIDPKTGRKKSSGPDAEANGSRIPQSVIIRGSPTPEAAEEPAPEPVRAEPAQAGPDNTPAPTSAYANPTAPSNQHPAPTAFDYRKLETCKYWMVGECRYDDRTCWRAHKFPPPTGKDLTCYYWKVQGYCKKSEENCKYAHHETGYDAPPPPTLQIPPMTETSAQRDFSPIQEPPTSARPSNALDASALTPVSASDIPTRQVTCYYWRTRGYCTKPDDVCIFAHRDTGHYAGPPGSFKKGQSVSSVASSANPNTIPVANRDNVALVAPHSARSPDPPAADRRDARDSWMQQTVARTKQPDQGSPVHLTDSPIHMTDSTLREQAPPTPQWNIMGAAMQRRASAPNFSMKATLALPPEMESQKKQMDVKLDILDLSSFKRLAGSDPFLQIDNMVMAGDFENLLWDADLRNSYCSGGIFVDAKHSSDVGIVAELCKTNVAGLIGTPEGHQSRILIYPGNAEEWRFLEENEQEMSSECVLHFRLFDDLPEAPSTGTALQSTSVDQRSPAQMLGEDLVNLDSEVIFPAKELKKHPVRAVFLMMPPTYQAELAIFAKYFAALKCKVYHSGEPGAWDYFRKKYSNSCALIVHPDVQLWRVPDLYAFLASTGAGVRMFSIGVNHAVAMLEDRQAEFGCERLFPHGTVVFIMDDTFIHHPETATEILRRFVAAHEKKPPGGETSRIATRPDVVEWLFDLAVARTGDRGRRDNRWMKLYSNICKLARLDLEDEDSDDPDQEHSDESRYLVTLSTDLLPVLQSLEEDGDQAAATDVAVEWFAGWSLLNASRYRKFVVCHGLKPDTNQVMASDGTSATDPRGWGKKYQHIGVVPPEEALQMLKK